MDWFIKICFHLFLGGSGLFLLAAAWSTVARVFDSRRAAHELTANHNAKINAGREISRLYWWLNECPEAAKLIDIIARKMTAGERLSGIEVRDEWIKAVMELREKQRKATRETWENYLSRRNEPTVPLSGERL